MVKRKHKINVLEVLFGVALVVITIADVVPGDELVGVPSGFFFIIHGLGFL